MINSARNRFAFLFILSFYLTKQYVFHFSVFNYILEFVASFYLLSIISYFICRYLISILPIIPIDSSNKAVIVTGAASGFGRDLTIRLDKLGFVVFAGVRKVSNDPRVDALKEKCSNRLQVIKIDITSDDDVRDAVITIEKVLQEKQLQLWSLVNNAGILTAHELIDGDSIEMVQKMMDTNALSAVRVSKAFIPLLAQTPNSRIVLVSSVSAHVSIPIMAGYCMSKHAMKAFGDGLRREIKRFGIHVAMVEPSVYDTQLTTKDDLLKSYGTIRDETPESIKKLSSEQEMETVMEFMFEVHSMTHNNSKPVIDLLEIAVITSGEPEHRYQATDPFETVTTHCLSLPSEIVDEIFTLWFMKLYTKLWRWFNK